MIWIIGEYAERIDNADELLESFLEGFQDENTQVKCLDMVKLRKCVPIDIHLDKPNWSCQKNASHTKKQPLTRCNYIYGKFYRCSYSCWQPL